MRFGQTELYIGLGLLALTIIAVLFAPRKDKLALKQQRAENQEKRLDIRADKSSSKQMRKNCRAQCRFGFWRPGKRSRCISACMDKQQARIDSKEAA